jgi:hypothetical protein
MDRITPEDIKSLGKGFVLVFGSNEMGVHGAGAAAFAFDKCGARLGQGYGFAGLSFAIPTKDWDIEVLPLDQIEHYVKGFVRFVKRKIGGNWKFYVTRIGCGLAGYKPEEIAPMFKELRHHPAVWLPQDFIDVIDGKTIGYDTAKA